MNEEQSAYLTPLVTTLMGDAPEGDHWPDDGYTMIGIKRLDNIQQLYENVSENNIPGDLVECGVWKGGACIFMRALLKAYDDNTRRVWVVDSFQGCPPPNAEKYPHDDGDPHSGLDKLKITQATVSDNFNKFGLLDDRVVFLEGWFKDTLPDTLLEQISILRMDGDLYESTMDCLTNLYHKVSSGGFVIVDDYGLGPCKQAVTD